MVGVPRRTKRVKRDWSMWEYFWKAMFFTTGGSWWWSPISTTRFSRDRPSCKRPASPASTLFAQRANSPPQRLIQI
eukprot:781637-Pyramimonas_sp.AAC.2